MDNPSCCCWGGALVSGASVWPIAYRKIKQRCLGWVDAQTFTHASCWLSACCIPIVLLQRAFGSANREDHHCVEKQIFEADIHSFKLFLSLVCGSPVVLSIFPGFQKFLCKQNNPPPVSCSRHHPKGYVIITSVLLALKPSPDLHALSWAPWYGAEGDLDFSLGFP